MKVVPKQIPFHEPDSDGPIFRGWTWRLDVQTDDGVVIGHGDITGPEKAMQALADDINNYRRTPDAR